jgi:hypothetical protein
VYCTPLLGALVALGLLWLFYAACIYLCLGKWGDHFLYTPNMRGNASFHCWRHAQRPMDAAEIVVHVMQGNRVLKIRDLL